MLYLYIVNPSRSDNINEASFLNIFLIIPNTCPKEYLNSNLNTKFIFFEISLTFPNKIDVNIYIFNLNIH